MRLLAVVEYYPPVLGHDLRIYELARRLPSDWDVQFLVVPSMRRLMEGKATDTDGGPRDQRIVPHRVSVPNWVRACWRANWTIGYLVTSALVFLRALRVTREVDPELVLSNYPSPYTGLLGYLLGRLRSVPHVVDFCDDIVSYFQGLYPAASGGALTRGAGRIQEFLVRRSAVLPAVTQSLREYAIRAGADPGRIEVLANGVDRTLFDRIGKGQADGPMAPASRSFTCFYAGSLEPWAGTDLLIEIARQADREAAPINLAVAGNPLEAPGNPLPRALQHLGLLSKEEVAEALARADCVLVPLRPGPAAEATSPVKLFEGLAAGKPCICSRVAGICDVIIDGENGLLVDSLDPRAWLERIRLLSSDRRLRDALSRAARETAARYDWAVLAERFGALLRRGVDRPS